MSKIERARYQVGSRIVVILITATMTALMMMGVIPIDRSDFTIMILQIIVVSIATVVVASVLSLFFFGRKPI